MNEMFGLLHFHINFLFVKSKEQILHGLVFSHQAIGNTRSLSKKVLLSWKAAKARFICFHIVGKVANISKKISILNANADWLQV